MRVAPSKAIENVQRVQGEGAEGSHAGSREFERSPMYFLLLQAVIRSRSLCCVVVDLKVLMQCTSYITSRAFGMSLLEFPCFTR